MQQGIAQPLLIALRASDCCVTDQCQQRGHGINLSHGAFIFHMFPVTPAVWLVRPPKAHAAFFLCRHPCLRVGGEPGPPRSTVSGFRCYVCGNMKIQDCVRLYVAHPSTLYFTFARSLSTSFYLLVCLLQFLKFPPHVSADVRHSDPLPPCVWQVCHMIPVIWLVQPPNTNSPGPPPCF